MHDIAIISRSKAWGGGSVLSSIDLANYLARLGRHVLLCFVENIPGLAIKISGNYEPETIHHNINVICGTLSEICSQLVSRRPKCIIGSSTPLFCFASDLSNGLMIPYALIVRGGTIGASRTLSIDEIKAIQGASAVACVASHLIPLVCSISASPPILLRHSIRCFLDLSGSLSCKQPGRVCYFGQFIHRKRVDLLPKIMQLYAAMIPISPTLSLIGNGPLLQSVVDEATTLGISTESHGWLERDNLIRELQRSQFALFPSGQEGRPRSLLEAVFFDVFPIATSIPAHSEVLGDTVSHFQWKYGSANDAANALYRASVTPVSDLMAICRKVRKYEQSLIREFSDNVHSLLELLGV